MKTTAAAICIPHYCKIDKLAKLSILVLQFGYLLTCFCWLVLICDKKEKLNINNGVLFRVKLRLRKYSLQRKRLADTAFLRQIQLSYGRYGFLTADTAFLLSTLSLQLQLQLF